MELCVVSCGKKKIWDKHKNTPERVPAAKAYVGTLTRLAIRYAETFYPDSWVILSGKYGFLYPWEEIENYDVKLVKLNEEFLNKLRRQIVEKSLYRYRKVIVLGGENYVEACRKAFSSYDIPVIDPLAGLGMFNRIRLLSRAVKERMKIEDILCRRVF